MLFLKKMEGWKIVCVILCAYGFFKSIRPSEAFLYQYLNGPHYNLTDYELNAIVFPVATYAYLGVLVVILLVTDFLRYKPIIILEALTLIGTYATLIWGRTLVAAQIVEFLYAISSACEVAYFTYIYAKVAGEQYQRVTSYTRAAVLGGFFLSGVLGQALVSTKAMDYYELNFLTLSGGIIALILSLILPKVTTSIYFHQDNSASALKPESHANLQNGSLMNNSNESVLSHHSYDGTTTVETPVVPNAKLTFQQKIKFGFQAIIRDMKYSYSKVAVVKWSVWWACGTCLNLQIAGYIQPMWEAIYPASANDIYNGAVESTHMLLGALAALAIGFIHLDWSRHGEWMLCVISMLDAVCLFTISTTNSIWVAYVMYVVFRVAYQIMITIASFEVAKDLREDTHGLIFGCNTFFALFLQTILVLVVTDENGLALESRDQYLVYGGCALFLAVIFLISAFFTWYRRRKHVLNIAPPH